MLIFSDKEFEKSKLIKGKKFLKRFLTDLNNVRRIRHDNSCIIKRKQCFSFICTYLFATRILLHYLYTSFIYKFYSKYCYLKSSFYLNLHITFSFCNCMDYILHLFRFNLESFIMLRLFSILFYVRRSLYLLVHLLSLKWHFSDNF